MSSEAIGTLHIVLLIFLVLGLLLVVLLGMQLCLFARVWFDALTFHHYHDDLYHFLWLWFLIYGCRLGGL